MVQSGSLSLFFDYVDPASFILELRLRKWEGLSSLPLELSPFEVRLPGEPLLHPMEDGWAQHWKKTVAMARRMGIPLVSPWIVPRTRKAHELAMHARQNGCFQEIHNALFRAYLQEGRDIGRIDVLVEIAGEHDLDPFEAKAVLDVGRWESPVEEAGVYAVELGITRTPTLLREGRTLVGFGDEWSLEAFLHRGTQQKKT